MRYDDDAEHEHNLTPAQRELEAALRTVTPPEATLDPMAAAFEAGRRSTRGQLHAWRSAAAAMLLAVGATWVVASRSRQEAATTPPDAIRPRVLVVQSQPTPSPRAAIPAQSVLMLQHAVREGGLSGLPAAPLPQVPAALPREML